MATDLERFFDYARAFEMAYVADTWSGLEPFFAEDARHTVEDAGPLALRDHGRTAVVEGLRQGAMAVDRRFDVRIPEIIDGPSCRPDGIWMRFALTFRRAGLPELRLEGEHLARYEDGQIAALEERLAPGMSERVVAYLDEHGPRLRPAGSPFHFDLAPLDRRDLDLAVQRTIVRSYASAKSNQDLGAALALCSRDFRLETVCIGLATRDRDEAAQQLAVFFTAFPDYGVTLHGMAAEGTHVACWGDARMTFAGPFLGHAPTNKTAVLPYVAIFSCADAMLRGERFFFDLAALCRQIGLSQAAVVDALAPLRSDSRTSDDRAPDERNARGAIVADA
jgi:predicted ester cyclase